MKNWFIIHSSRVMAPGALKNWWLRKSGAQIHKSAWISPDVLIDPVYPELITIEEDVFIGWGARIFTHMIDKNEKEFTITQKKVHLCRGCFVGGFSTIRPGVTLGRESKVGSDSLVLKSIEEGCTVAGTPAKPLELP